MTGTTSRPGLAQVPIDRWAQRAMDRPWRYATTWAIGVGAANLGLRMLLNDLSLARNTRLAALTALGFLLFAWLYTAQLTRPLRRPPRPDTQTEARFKEVTVRSSSAVGVDGHQWNVECAPGARLPCRGHVRMRLDLDGGAANPGAPGTQRPPRGDPEKTVRG